VVAWAEEVGAWEAEVAPAAGEVVPEGGEVAGAIRVVAEVAVEAEVVAR
jgi:hypothetical protein